MALIRSARGVPARFQIEESIFLTPPPPRGGRDTSHPSLRHSRRRSPTEGIVRRIGITKTENCPQTTKPHKRTRSPLATDRARSRLTSIGRGCDRPDDTTEYGAIGRSVCCGRRHCCCCHCHCCCRYLFSLAGWAADSAARARSRSTQIESVNIGSSHRRSTHGDPRGHPVRGRVC